MIIEHAFSLSAPPETVFAHLASPENYVGLSPLVVAVRDIADRGGVTRYKAVERFTLHGRLHYDNVIAVTLLAEAASLTVSGDVASPGWVRMTYRYVITPGAAGGADVTDTLHLQAPPGLRRFAGSRAREVQLARARILAGRLAG